MSYVLNDSNNTNVFFIHVQFVKCLVKKVSLDEFEQKVRSMRILENVELPESFKKTLLDKDKQDSPQSPTNFNKKVKTEAKLPRGKENMVDQLKAKNKEKDEARKAAIDQGRIPKPEVLVRMANLSVIGGYKVNGVAAIHSEIVKNEVFKDFYQVAEAIIALFLLLVAI
jgi:starch phosphorylase